VTFSMLSMYKESIDDTCAICCHNFEEKQKLRVMPLCNHTFHKECIDKWLKLKGKCPNCNSITRDALASSTASAANTIDQPWFSNLLLLNALKSLYLKKY
jgi:hypothetical protein